MSETKARSTFDGQPQMLHHAGHVTADAAATVEFYNGILGMDFTATVMDDKIPSTGDPFPYLHLFFKMADGSTIAFFESPSLTPPSPISHPAYDVFNHTALAAQSREEVDEWARHLTAHGVDVVGPIDHGVIYSIYFYDPNGLRLEITVSMIEGWDDHPAEARDDLAAWEAAKKEATQSGQDLTQAMLALIEDRKDSLRDRGVIPADEIPKP